MMTLPLLSLQSRARAAALALVLALAALAACAAPAPSATDTPPTAAEPTAANAPATSPGGGSRADEPPAPSSKKRLVTGGPLPPERVDDRKLPAEVKLDTSCKTDADCTVKNVGNCCGEYPACVNVASPTDPKGVQARCAQSGMSAVCGFPQISGCSCVQGTCQAASSNIVEETTR